MDDKCKNQLNVTSEDLNHATWIWIMEVEVLRSFHSTGHLTVLLFLFVSRVWPMHIVMYRETDRTPSPISHPFEGITPCTQAQSHLAAARCTKSLLLSCLWVLSVLTCVYCSSMTSYKMTQPMTSSPIKPVNDFSESGIWCGETNNNNASSNKIRNIRKLQCNYANEL